MASAPGADRADDADPDRPLTVAFIAPDGRTDLVEVAAGGTVLDAGLRAGLDLPHRCLQGWCLTCAGRLSRGAVDQHDARRYFESDRVDGFILLCTAVPQTDLVVETRARDLMRAARAARRLPFPKGDWGDGPTAPDDADGG